ncbi:conserved Plasmodium protein, unknown function [Plasmodium vinckei brucechwatti]|uniref:Uncharacterized protein n=1 Tax=Plasmodium vinckei brucechwatti TaxID=119398 RepID=A0A6V7S2G2_PLAVN|nr:conserved Plasmodium protein, unknown function [Plasmodium vinckei brucechwatti]
MNFKYLDIHVQVKCISFCSSNFIPKSTEEANCENTDIVENKFINTNKKDEPDLNKLVGNIFIGKIVKVEGNSTDIITGKNIIGIFTINSKINKDIIIVPYHTIIEYPSNDLSNDHLLCAILRSLYESHLCLNSINIRNKLEYIAIFSNSIFEVLPLLKLLLKKKVFILIFLPNAHINQHEIQKKFKEFHITNESIKEYVSTFDIDINVTEHIHNITNKCGIKNIIIYPNINTNTNVLKKIIFTISALNSNLIFTYQFDYLNPYECKLLYDKSITMHFFNINYYILYDYFKTADSFNFAILSLLNKDIEFPSVSITKKYFSDLEEIFPLALCSEAYTIYVNKNMEGQKSGP